MASIPRPILDMAEHPVCDVKLPHFTKLDTSHWFFLNDNKDTDVATMYLYLLYSYTRIMNVTNSSSYEKLGTFCDRIYSTDAAAINLILYTQITKHMHTAIDHI